MKIFGFSLREYFSPIKYYVLASVLIVISQYTIALPLNDNYPFLVNLTQALWALMVALSVITLVKKYDFGIKNILFVGVLYCFIIHGLKVSIRYFFYGRTDMAYILNRFFYGSFLVMVTAIVIGIVFLFAKKRKLL